ncbi:hypothetical protein [Bacillus subtilis]|uniref:hypothetical protein n=1 Tax=Bacillus subtilis TaxID=1423 RepID=UPI0020274C7C|nr:hypothetical protein [Bacillus subtilis]
MSKPLTTAEKIKILWKFVFGRKTGVIIDCAFCAGTNITFKSSNTKEDQGQVVYYSQYVCNSCGACCENKQVWEG